MFSNGGSLSHYGFDSFAEGVPGWDEEGLDCSEQNLEQNSLRILCEYQEMKPAWVPGWQNAIKLIGTKFYQEYKIGQLFCNTGLDGQVCHNDAYEVLCEDISKF